MNAPPPQDTIMQYFALPQGCDDPILVKYSAMATWLHETMPRNAERTVALRKLLESRDSALRAAVTV